MEIKRYERQGIDVSKWQGNIDFEKVRKDGISFVIIKCGDGNFEKNYAGAKAAGLDTGAYWYSRAESVSDAAGEAEKCFEKIRGKRFEYPIYFDLELKSQFEKGMEFCTSLVKTFCSALEKKGLFTGLYMSRSPLENFISKETAERYVVWVAEHGEICKYKGSYGMWQYTGTGNVDGISAIVDRDVCYADYPRIIKNGGFNGFPKRGF